MATYCIEIPEMAVEIPGVGSVQWYYPAGAALLLFILFVVIVILRRKRKKPAKVEEKKPDFVPTEKHKEEVKKYNVVEAPRNVEEKMQEYDKTDDVFAEAPAKEVNA